MPITAQKPQNGSSFGWPVGQNQFSKPKFVDTFHPQNRPRKPPPPAYNSLPISKSAEVVSKVSMNGPVPTAATEKVKNQVLPSKPHSTILACSLLPTLICGHVKKLIGIPQSSSLPRLTKSKSGKIQSAKNSKPNISSRSLSQIPTLSKSRNSESNGTNVSNKSDENVSKSAIERRTKFAGIKSMGAAQAKRSLSMAEETRNRSENVLSSEKPKTPIQKTPSNPSSISSGASKTDPESALNSAPNTVRLNPPSNELQRRFSLTLGSQTPLIAAGNRNHSGNKYDESYPFDDVDALFSASDSEATNAIGPGGMNRIRLRRKVEMGAEAALPPMIPVPSQHKPLLYQDLPSCEPAQLNRPSPSTSIPLPSSSAARPIRIPQSQNGHATNVQTPTGASNVQPTVNGKISSGNSSANKSGGLRIRQRIVTNPRVTHSQMITPSTMAMGTMQVHQMCIPPQYQQNFSPSASARCSSSASSSTGSTATSYKTAGTDPEFESSSISSGRLCHQFPLNSTNNNCLQYLQKPNSARRHEHSPSPYDLPNGTLNGNGMGENSNGIQNLPAFIFLPPTNQLGPPMPMSASSASSGKSAGNGKGQCSGMEAQPCPQNAYSYQTSPSNRTTRKSMSGVQNNPKPAVMSNTGVAVTQEVNGHHHTFSVNPSDSKSSTQPHQILVQPSQSAAVVHQRQHSHNKNSVKSTEFPVLINGSQSNGSIKQQQNGIALNGTNSSTNSSRMSMPAAPTLDRGQKELKKKHSETTQVSQNTANLVQDLPQAPKVVISSAKVAIDSRPNPNNDVAKATHEPRRSKSEKSGSKMKVENFSALTNFGQESGIPNASHSNVVMVRLTPEAQRKCEISISGGSDFSHPAIISRMVFSTSNGNVPMSCPLNEGDQVLKINGCDIGQWPQAKVQTFLSELKTSNVDIILAIKPNVYRCGDLNEDDDSSRPFNNSSPAETARSSHIRQSSNIDLGIKAACGLPESQHVPEAVPKSDKLAQSLLLLKEALASGRVAQQFDQLYRKKPGLTMNDSKLPQNIQKNRYRDVCPYDSTRVRLITAPSGDYINACHVNMEIPTSGIVNRYIATQGPLPHTSGDFWHMVWEQSATAIVMLTTIMEKGRVKCHQYWPEVGESMDLGSYLQVKNVSEKVEAHCHYRELVVKNLLTGEERNVTQMQYRSWPDHGVPDNPQHFIDFVSEVRKARNGSLDPIIVHCSAGIGRTGVLILMETAACQIEANEPVYPLDIMKVMRDQRAMLIQTAEQYVFVCNSIIKAYQDQSVKPLEEYQKKTGTCKV